RLTADTPMNGMSWLTSPLRYTSAGRLHVIVPVIVATCEVVLTTPVDVTVRPVLSAGASALFGLKETLTPATGCWSIVPTPTEQLTLRQSTTVFGFGLFTSSRAETMNGVDAMPIGPVAMYVSDRVSHPLTSTAPGAHCTIAIGTFAGKFLTATCTIWPSTSPVIGETLMRGMGAVAAVAGNAVPTSAAAATATKAPRRWMRCIWPSRYDVGTS